MKELIKMTYIKKRKYKGKKKGERTYNDGEELVGGGEAL